MIDVLIAKISSLASAAIGSALSIYLQREKAEKMGKVEIALVFIFGVSIAHYLGGAAIEYWTVNPLSLVADAIKFTIGLFGMGMLSQAMIQIPDIVKAARKRFIGDI